MLSLGMVLDIGQKLAVLYLEGQTVSVVSGNFASNCLVNKIPFTAVYF